jgi:hypothetical protein
MNAVFQHIMLPSTGLPFFYGESKNQESRWLNKSRLHLRAGLDSDISRSNTFDPAQLRPLSESATELPMHQKARINQPKEISSFNEAAISGTNYITRYPQSIASGLSKTPLKGTKHENDAPIGDNFPVEVLGAFNAIHCIGGAIETGLALENVSSTLKAISNRDKVNAHFAKKQQALDSAHCALQISKQRRPFVQHFCSIAKSAWVARSAKSRLDAAISQAPEHVTDAVRYTAVSWASRIFSILKLAFRASTWIALAANIIGVIGSAFQTVTGIFKWYSSNKAVENAKRMLHLVENCKSIENIHFSEISADEIQLQTHLIGHIRAKRENMLQKAKDKRVKARIETLAGIGATIFGALAFIFPPLGLVAIGIGLAYAGYRVYKGIESFFSKRKQDKREKEMRVDFSGENFIGNMVAENPYYAVHHLVNLIQQNTMPWLPNLLSQLGIPRADREAVFLLAQTNDTAAACHALEQMLFGNDWALTL